MVIGNNHIIIHTVLGPRAMNSH